MADGAGGIGSQIGDTLKDIGKDLTVNLASDMFNQIAGTKPANQVNPQNNTQMQQVQKNAQIASITRQIQGMQQKRQAVAQQAKYQEQQRMHAIEQAKFQKQEGAAGGGEAKKGGLKGIFANWGNTLARRGKGEQRGNKAVG